MQIPRSDGVIIVKSNSISSMQLVSNSNPKKMTIYTKAVISKVDALGVSRLFRQVFQASRREKITLCAIPEPLTQSTVAWLRGLP